MANIFGANIDFIPGVNVRQTLDNIYRGGGIPGFYAGAYGAGMDVVDPNVDLVKGVGFNEASRNAVQKPGGGTTTQVPQPISDPYGGGGTYYGGGGGGGGGVASSYAQTSDPSTAAYYQDMIDQLNGQNGRLDGQLNTGLGNINNSYNQQSNRLNEQKGVAERNYNVQTQQNMQQYGNTRNGIMSNTRATANALQRLLGLNGAGNSSAALEQAPYAAGLQGSQNLNEAQQNYSRNNQGLKMSWEDTERTFKNNFQDLDNQKYSQENNLRSQINQTRAGLLDKLAQASTNREMALGKNYQQAQAARSPYQQQINSLLDSIAGLGNQFANPVMRTGDVSFKAPELGEFSLGRQAGIQNQTGGGGNLDPTFINLLANRDDERNRNQLI